MKIKNRISACVHVNKWYPYIDLLLYYSLVKKARVHIATMGETGAGITSEEQINMESDSMLATKWG
jgi:hypothetical protein